jgi:hypothetical protein
MPPTDCFDHYAQVRAASDLRALARLIPSESRLLLDPTGSSSGSGSSGMELVMVPTSSVRAGDILRVLPGAEQRLTKATRKVALPDIVLLFACVHPPLLHGGARCRMPTVSSRNTPACFTNNNTTLHPLAPPPLPHPLVYVCVHMLMVDPCRRARPL